MSTERFFHETISCWDDWGRVFQSIPAFSALTEEIYRREQLPFAPLQNLTPGTNAVFQVGNTVAKIFFPKESGLDPTPDFQNEAAVCGWLTARGIPTPRLLAQGKLPDKYLFYYILTEFSQGQEAGGWLEAASAEQKVRFAGELQKVLCKLNCPADDLLPAIDLKERAIHNSRLAALPETLQQEMRQRALRCDLSQRVLVHGDLTGENLLVTPQGTLTVIDCADACLAPAWYELAPIVFELFRCESVLLREFAGEGQEEFLEQVLDAVCLHDFGANLLLTAARREHLPIFPGLAAVKEFLERKLRE